MTLPIEVDRLTRRYGDTVVADEVSFTVQPGHLYTLTTTTGQGKGTATGPAKAPLKLPTSENICGYFKPNLIDP